MMLRYNDATVDAIGGALRYYGDMLRYYGATLIRRYIRQHSDGALLVGMILMATSIRLLAYAYADGFSLIYVN